MVENEKLDLLHQGGRQILSQLQSKFVEKESEIKYLKIEIDRLNKLLQEKDDEVEKVIKLRDDLKRKMFELLNTDVKEQ